MTFGLIISVMWSNTKSSPFANDFSILNQHAMKKTIFRIVAGLSLFCGLSSRAQTNARVTNAEVAAKRVLTQFLTLSNQKKLKSDAAKSLLSGEATRFSETDTLGQLSTPDAFQLMDARHVVARVQGLDGKVPVADLYFYLTLSGTSWKVSAMRSLALTGIIEMAMQELQNKPKLTTQERQELANMRLTLSLDRDLRAYFKKNRSQFDRLRKLAAKDSKTAEDSLHKLGLSYFSNEKGTNLKFVIGGAVDNTVGFIYSPSNRPPKITPDEYIWVEKIADKWFLFRTT
jgi:hypothetical protein